MTDDAVRFGQFRFDLRRRELFRDESSVRLGGRALDVLHALAAAKGDVVSKTELLARVWPGTAVGENNLQVQISLLRKTLQENAGGESYLVTVPSRGYLLEGGVRKDAQRCRHCRPRYARARAGPAGQAFDRGLAFREHERRPGTGLFRGRNRNSSASLVPSWRYSMCARYSAQKVVVGVKVVGGLDGSCS